LEELVSFGNLMASADSGHMPMPKPDEYLRVKEAATLLGVSPNTIRSWGGDGKIPEYRHPINRFRLYKRAELENVLRGIERSNRKTSRATT
jgi:excisionase family DNA binding protein